MTATYFMDHYGIGLCLWTFAQSSKYSIFYSTTSKSIIMHLLNIQVFVPFTFETRFSVNETNLSNTNLIVYASDNSSKCILYTMFIRIPVIDLTFNTSPRRNWFHLVVYCHYRALIFTVCTYLSYLNHRLLSKWKLLFRYCISFTVC